MDKNFHSIPYKIGDTTVHLIEYFSKRKSKILYLNVHSDETTSIETILEFQEKNKLHFTHIQHKQERKVSFEWKNKSYQFDPNRIYTENGIKNTIIPQEDVNQEIIDLVNGFASFILNNIRDYEILVTLHNNFDPNYNIDSYLPGGDEAENTKEVYKNESLNPNENIFSTYEFVYTTEKKYFDHLKNQKLNVILQDNEKPVDDGSLSVYCGKNNIPYMNIEAKIGAYQQQLKMIEMVHKMLKNVK